MCCTNEEKKYIINIFSYAFGIYHDYLVVLTAFCETNLKTMRV